nr:MAG TPA: hypothetical protein [Crassvirales sp.]
MSYNLCKSERFNAFKSITILLIYGRDLSIIRNLNTFILSLTISY